MFFFFFSHITNCSGNINLLLDWEPYRHSSGSLWQSLGLQTHLNLPIAKEKGAM